MIFKEKGKKKKKKQSSFLEPEAIYFSFFDRIQNGDHTADRVVRAHFDHPLPRIKIHQHVTRTIVPALVDRPRFVSQMRGPTTPFVVTQMADISLFIDA